MSEQEDQEEPHEVEIMLPAKPKKHLGDDPDLDFLDLPTFNPISAPKREVVLDPRTMYKLAAMHCTYKEIASWYGVTPETVKWHLKKDEKLKEAYDMGLEVGKISLRRAQMRMAMENPTMAIFLGKQLLDQIDESTLRHKNPPQVVVKWQQDEKTHKKS